ncbi:hypothetical protein C6P44_001013 [Monosporozyma unispora]|nr:hypothetical protein C6P44_001013 [Kazachstania unispora]
MPKKHLIILPCHGVWEMDLTLTTQNCGQLSENWFLAPFQIEGNDHLVFIKPSLRAVEELLSSYDQGVILFSGSQTKTDAGPISEAQSYFMLIQKLITLAFEDAEKKSLIQVFKEDIISSLSTIVSLMELRNITLSDLFTTGVINTEEYSLDSFDNLLYSIFRFKEITNTFPERITIVGFGFKESRFLNYHAKALDIPKEMINYISYDPEPLDYSPKQLDQYFTTLTKMEHKNALSLFDKDWYAKREILLRKKEARNSYKRVASYNGLEKLHLDNIMETDEAHYQTYIKGKMPWSQ